MARELQKLTVKTLEVDFDGEKNPGVNSHQCGKAINGFLGSPVI